MGMGLSTKYTNLIDGNGNVGVELAKISRGVYKLNVADAHFQYNKNTMRVKLSLSLQSSEIP